MKSITLFSAAALFASLFSSFTTAARNKPSAAVLLSSVNTLTLRSDKKTTHRRVSAIPQLQCVGGNAKGLYDVDVMRCKNAGSDYDGDNIQWTCTASLPEEFKLGSTDVLCEGYDSPDDPYILKGSCGVQYRLVLTDKGEERYGNTWKWGKGDKNPAYDGTKTGVEMFVTGLFWCAFFGVICWMLYRCVQDYRDPNRPRDPFRPRFGGGGGGGNDDDDPPPPYDYQPPRKPRTYAPRQPRQQQAQEGWRPGLWTGVLGGAAAGYMAGNRGNGQNRTDNTFQRPRTETRPGGGWFGGGGGGSRWDNGEGSSGTSGSGRSSSSSSSARHESTGFGSTSRR